MLLIKDNQLMIQATIRYNRQRVCSHIGEDTCGWKWQETNTEWLKWNRNLLICVTQVLQEKEGLQATVGPYQNYQKSVNLHCSVVLFSWLFSFFNYSVSSLKAMGRWTSDLPLMYLVTPAVIDSFPQLFHAKSWAWLSFLKCQPGSGHTEYAHWTAWQ